MSVKTGKVRILTLSDLEEKTDREIINLLDQYIRKQFDAIIVFSDISDCVKVALSDIMGIKIRVSDTGVKILGSEAKETPFCEVQTRLAHLIAVKSGDNFPFHQIEKCQTSDILISSRPPLEINLNPEETERKAEYLREIKDIYDDSGGDEFSEKDLKRQRELEKIYMDKAGDGEVNLYMYCAQPKVILHSGRNCSKTIKIGDTNIISVHGVQPVTINFTERG